MGDERVPTSTAAARRVDLAGDMRGNGQQALVTEDLPQVSGPRTEPRETLNREETEDPDTTVREAGPAACPELGTWGTGGTSAL